MATTLQGVKVLDLSRVISGPSAAQILADLGADVIKVERAGIGDESRGQGAPLKDRDGRDTRESATFVAMNRGKRSITADLTKPSAQRMIGRLAQWADVVIENFKAGDLKRYGLDYASLSALNPRLVYCSISGFGQTGPSSHLPGYDLLFQGMSGLMSIVGVPDGEPGGGPQRVGYPLVDMTTSLYAVIGILGALHHRDHVSNEGQHIDLALLDAQISVMSQMAAHYRISGDLPRRAGIISRITVPYQPFECADGTLLIAVANDLQFGKLVRALGHAEWAEDPRFVTNGDRVAHRFELVPMISEILRGQPMQHWMSVLNAAGVPNGPIYDFAQMAADPQVVHRGMLTEMPHPLAGSVPIVASPLNFSKTPVRYDRPPPLLGEHTDEILREIGYDDAAIARLRDDKAI